MSRQPRDRAILHRIARELEPTELPFYIAAPSRPGQLAGWYWTPAGADNPEPLGANVYLAQAMLLQIADQRTAA